MEENKEINDIKILLQDVQRRLRLLEGTSIDVVTSAPSKRFVNKIVAEHIYVGTVQSGGTNLNNPFPDSWSSTKVSTGVYTVTHNLNITQANEQTVILVQGASAAGSMTELTARAANSFTYETRNASGTLADMQAFFILIRGLYYG